jgi:Nicotinic acid phosphoribosyltransferase
MPARPRLDPEIFNLPVAKMRAGYYSDKYFVRARDILLADGYRPRVTMQVFGKAPAFLGGVDEAIAILKLCAVEWPELEVRALYDGDEVKPWETVLLIEGPYDAFAHLETLYLGVLSRRTRVPQHSPVVEAAAPKEILFFPAVTITGWCRPATGTPRTLPAPSASPPTRRRPGGGAKGWAPCPMRSLRLTAATPCSPPASLPTISVLR